MTIIDAYRQRHAEQMAGETETRPSHIAVGTGIVESGEASKLGALVSELHREPITARWLTGTNSDAARFSAIFTKGVANDTWTEVGLFNAASGGDMLARDENVDGFCTKTASQVKVVVVQLRIA